MTYVILTTFILYDGGVTISETGINPFGRNHEHTYPVSLPMYDVWRYESLVHITDLLALSLPRDDIYRTG